MSNPSVMDHSFSVVPDIKTPRSMFDRSHAYKTTFDAGYLVPFFYDDVMPGDTFNLNAQLLVRLNTLYNPIMDNCFIDTHFFFVPYRLIWTDSRAFFGERIQPDSPIDYVVPVRQAEATSGFLSGSIADYLGMPTSVPGIQVSDLPFRAYWMVWNEWFRDQNLQDIVQFPLGSGSISNSDGELLLRRGKRHDYFTSCLPWPQKGDSVTLPLGTTAPIVPSQAAARPEFYSVGTGAQAPITTLPNENQLRHGTASALPGTLLWSDPQLQTDLQNATAASINDLREAFQVQKLLERDARAGTRYSEIVRSHFGVDFYDISYRPEFLGGGTSMINIQQVPITTTIFSTNAGELAAYGVDYSEGHGFTKTFVEHGIVLGLVSVRADLTYQQGLPREFSKRTRYDYYWPTLAHLGEQAVLNKEIFTQGTPEDDNVFGYQERYSEYRYKQSRITGKLRSNDPLSLDIWHLSQEFLNLPVLGSLFIQENPPFDRVVTTPSEPHFVLDAYFNLKCARPMPVFGVPGLIDHF